MNIEDEVSSPELSQRLKELGVNQDSCFYWDYNVYTNEDFKWKLIFHKDILVYKIDDYVSAFTVSELGKIIPKLHATYKEDDGSFVCCQFELPFGHREVDMTEANSRAKMLIYLKEYERIDNILRTTTRNDTIYPK